MVGVDDDDSRLAGAWPESRLPSATGGAACFLSAGWSSAGGGRTTMGLKDDRRGDWEGDESAGDAGDAGEAGDDDTGDDD